MAKHRYLVYKLHINGGDGNDDESLLDLQEKYEGAIFEGDDFAPDTIIALAEGVSIKQIRVTFDYVDEDNNVIPIDKDLPDVEFLPEVINYSDAELDEIEELLEDT